MKKDKLTNLVFLLIIAFALTNWNDTQMKSKTASLVEMRIAS